MKKGRNEDPRNWKPVSLIPGKVIHFQAHRGQEHHQQYGFPKGKSYLTGLITSWAETTGLVSDRRVVDVVCLPDFSQAFDTVSHQIFMKKLLKYWLDDQAVRWIKNGVSSQA